MDVVIPVKPGRNNEELRYALRSFEANLPHDRIWLIGAKPRWAVNVGYIPTQQRGLKYQNTTLALKTACEHKDVSEDFIYCNDDFFVMSPIDHVGTYHRGPVSELERSYARRYGPNAGHYLRGMTTTKKLLESMGHKEPMSYELHVPIVVNKEKMLKVLEIGKHIFAFHKRTAYGNLTSMGGIRIQDPKIVTRGTKQTANRIFLSTSDDSFRYGSVGEHIRNTFQKQSRYEPPIRRTR